MTPACFAAKKKWLCKIAPPLKISLFVLQMVKVAVGLPLPILGVGALLDQLGFEKELIADGVRTGVSLHGKTN